jgi:hypothetical protein
MTMGITDRRLFDGVRNLNKSAGTCFLVRTGQTPNDRKPSATPKGIARFQRRPPLRPPVASDRQIS